MKLNPLDPVTTDIDGYLVVCELCGRLVESRLAKVAELIRREHFNTTGHNSMVDPVFAETMSKTVRVSHA